MAKPAYPLEIWAVKDVTLPVTKKANKVRPINDLWDKGYDRGQKPGVEEFNYLFNMTTQWLSYISDEQIPGLDTRYLQQGLNLKDLKDIGEAQTNLQVYSKTISDQRYVNVTGDEMTGNLAVPRVNFNQASATDSAWIGATSPTNDKTYLDIGIGDNAGDPSIAESDLIRFRFKPTSSPEFSLVEINALDNSTGYMRVFGRIWGRQLDIAGNINWTGTGTGGSIALSNDLTANNVNTANLNVRNNNAVVAGRNIVRAINGVTADGDGNLNLRVANTTGNISPNGWWKDETTGLIHQWGLIIFNKNSSSSEYIPFNITFPNACFNIQMCNVENFNNEGNIWRVLNYNSAGFNMSNAGGNMFTGYFWTAVGN